MTEHDLRKYWEVYKKYWDLFRKYAAHFEDTDAYLQKLIHADDYIHQEYKSVNEALSYSMALATVKAVE